MKSGESPGGQLEKYCEACEECDVTDAMDDCAESDERTVARSAARKTMRPREGSAERRVLRETNDMRRLFVGVMFGLGLRLSLWRGLLFGRGDAEAHEEEAEAFANGVHEAHASAISVELVRRASPSAARPGKPGGGPEWIAGYGFAVAAGAAWGLRIWSAAGGKGWLAWESRRATCQICVSERRPR